MTTEEKREELERVLAREPPPELRPPAALRQLVRSVEYYGEPEEWPPGLWELLQLALPADERQSAT